MPKKGGSGVEIRAQSLRLYFRLEGKTVREPLDIPPTDENIEYAENLVRLIKIEIKTGRYDHAKHFPESKLLLDNQLNRWIDLYLLEKQNSVSPISYKTYRRRVERYIREPLGGMQPDKINHEVLSRWKLQYLQKVGNRTQREILTNLKGILRLCVINDKISKNPADYIEVGDADSPEPTPLSLSEIDAIATTSNPREGGVNLGLFLVWTGARVSEGIAARWEDIDLKKGTWNVSLACVDTVYKVPKTRKSARVVELMPQAIAILEKQQHTNQKQHSYYIDVLQRDNRSYKKMPFTPVFINTNTGLPWADSTRYRDGFWKTHLKHAGVKHRGAKQARHTWISLMLTYGMPLHWIIEQVGHSDSSMIHRHYGKLLKRRDGSRFSDEAARRINNDRIK